MGTEDDRFPFGVKGCKRPIFRGYVKFLGGNPFAIPILYPESFSSDSAVAWRQNPKKSARKRAVLKIRHGKNCALSMYGIFPYMWHIFMVNVENVGKYSIQISVLLFLTFQPGKRVFRGEASTLDIQTPRWTGGIWVQESYGKHPDHTLNCQFLGLYSQGYQVTSLQPFISEMVG